MSSLAFLNKRNYKPPRRAVNPLDKSTVVSIYPKRIEEVKVTIEPGRFVLEPGSVEKPSILVVGPSSWWREVGEEMPLLEIPTSSVVVADSIVKDYCNGILACDMGERMPGIFFLPGEYDHKRLTTTPEGKLALEIATKKQRRWYEELVKMADTLWARTNGNPITISDDMRLAARELNLVHSKEWVKDNIAMDMVKCPACGTFKNPTFPVCPHCKAVVDKKKAEELGLIFVK